MSEPEFLSLLLYLLVPLLVYKILKIVLPPWNFPRNIPTIPFYVSFLGLFTNLDQKEVYDLYLREKMEKYGAVKIYFASRWNILVTKPELLDEVLKDEDTFAKSGNHIKTPDSLLAAYTGDNIISAHGTVWKLYRGLLTNAVQFPSLIPVEETTAKMLNFMDQHIKNDISFSADDLTQRYTLQNLGLAYLNVDFKLFDSLSPWIHEKLRYIKSQIFKPFYLNFPILDSYPIKSRVKAREEVMKFRNEFCSLILRGESKETPMIRNLSKALSEKLITEKQFTDNALIIMIAGHENPLLLLTSLIYVLVTHPDVQDILRKEITSTKDPYTSPYLHAVIYETLRLYPPVGQLINRCASKDAWIKNIRIPKGAYVGYNNFATGRDRDTWKDSDSFQPNRWGNTLEEVNKAYVKAKSRAALSAFHGKRRACLGEKFALHEIKKFVVTLLGNYIINPDPEWEPKFTRGGVFAPAHMKVLFEKLEQDHFEDAVGH